MNMNEQKYSQLELFSRGQEPNSPRQARGNHFWQRIRVYEKTILMVMGFLVTGLVAFSLGVERGKSLTVRQPAIQTNLTRPLPVPQPVTEKKPLAPEPRQAVSPQNYTIQLASYKSKASAQKEAEILKKRGLNPLIVSKGQYAVLCVGTFSGKEGAKALLTELEKKYRGCFIRRI